jgi:hypothetical protein
MVVFGGCTSCATVVLKTGFVFNPTAQNTTATATAATARVFHSAVWTGQKMIVWGGIGDQVLQDGAIYQ